MVTIGHADQNEKNVRNETQMKKKKKNRKEKAVGGFDLRIEIT